MMKNYFIYNPYDSQFLLFFYLHSCNFSIKKTYCQRSFERDLFSILKKNFVIVGIAHLKLFSSSFLLFSEKIDSIKVRSDPRSRYVASFNGKLSF